MKIPELVGLTEIAMRAGVQKPVVSKWSVMYTDFPETCADLRTGPVWWWPDVENWLRATGRETDADWSWEQVNAANLRSIERQREAGTFKGPRKVEPGD